MKIWYLPPRFLDDSHLIQDYDNCVKLFNDEDLGVPDEFYAFLFLKLKLVEDELEKRDLMSDVRQVVSDDDMPDNLDDFEEPDYEQVVGDIQAIMGIWEVLLNEPFVNNIDARIEQLTLESYEDIYNELVFELQQKQNEYI